jgi:hypothetical protein
MVKGSKQTDEAKLKISIAKKRQAAVYKLIPEILKECEFDEDVSRILKFKISSALESITERIN